MPFPAWASTGTLDLMAGAPKNLEDRPTVLLVAPPPAGDMDEWFASLVHNEPTDLPVTAAELVAEGRAEAE